MALKTLKDHAIAASLARLQALLQDEALQSPTIASDEAAQFNRDKIQNITISLQSLVSQSPATMVSDTALNQMNTNLQAPINELTAFVANKNAGHLANAVAQLDQNVLSYTWAFLPKVNPLSKTGAGEIVDSLQERSRQSIAQINGQKEQLASAIAQLSETVLAQTVRLEELKDAQAQLKAEMAASQSNLETSFNKAQLQRDTDFAALVNESKDKLTHSERDFNTHSAGVIESLKTTRRMPHASCRWSGISASQATTRTLQTRRPVKRTCGAGSLFVCLGAACFWQELPFTSSITSL